MDVSRLLLAAFLALGAVSILPSASADPLCVFYREPPADSDDCVAINEDPDESNCAEFCFYVYTEQPLQQSYLCYRTTVHDPYRCTNQITELD